MSINDIHDCILVTTQSTPKCTVDIKLTSPVMRDEADEERQQDDKGMTFNRICS